MSTFANLLHELQPYGVLLPQMVFFDPNERFVKYLKAFRPTPTGIIDIGAGVGRMSKFLATHGLKCLAIDTCERPNEEFQIMEYDAIVFEYPPGSLPIMARPCHGVWIEPTIERALSLVPTMLYVGLSRNFENDLGGLDEKYKLTYEPFKVGRDGEQIVKIENL